MYNIYRTRTRSFPGTRYADVYKSAYHYYKQIKRKTRRRPYVRSMYFHKQKVFLELFWQHTRMHRNVGDKARRVKYFACAIELIQFSRLEPTTKENPNKSGELLHRFTGMTPNGKIFYVQIKERKRSEQKWLLSVFPEQK